MRNENRQGISEGMVVVLLMDKYPDKPLIDWINEVTIETLHVTRMYDHWTTSWTVCKQKEGLRYVEWQEEGKKSAVMLLFF